MVRLYLENSTFGVITSWLARVWSEICRVGSEKMYPWTSLNDHVISQLGRSVISIVDILTKVLTGGWLLLHCDISWQLHSHYVSAPCTVNLRG